jgi:hypothetical protein
MRRSAAALATAVALVILMIGAPAPGPASAAGCPVAPNPTALPSPTALRAMNKLLAGLGARPTGSPAQDAYIAWIRRELRAIPGVKLGQLDFPINRWTETAATLELRSGRQVTTLPIGGAVPYSRATPPRGVAAPLVYVPDDQAITAANAAGKVVVRPAPPGSTPQYDFLLPIVSWATYDPNHTIDPTSNFLGDFIAYNNRVADLRTAATAGAVGILFVKDIPRRQILGHYEPYEGSQWGLPGMFLGADEGKRITDALAAGTSPSARIVLRAHRAHVVTPSVLATIAGQSPQRIVIDSHTDGTNAAEDNGPIAMVAMARYLASLPMACRPRTIEFAFSTAHFYQRVASPSVRNGGAEQLARQLDREYDTGTVSSVLVLEHLGAIDYEPVPRSRGPGFVLRPNGLRAIQFIGITPSPALVSTVLGVVGRYDMQRTILLQGADAPGTTVPSHCSFGGEGTPFNHHLLPTIGVISAPQSLYDPSFGLEGIDFNVMHAELLGYTELVNRLGAMNQTAVAGSIPLERVQRSLGGTPCPPEN